MKNNFEFIGKPSTDSENFVWEVTKETYIKITSKEPEPHNYVDRDYQNGIFTHTGNMVMLYPDDIFFLNYDEEIFFEQLKKLKIKISYEEI